MEIQKGSVVQLKSGGPRMTVDDIGDDGEIFCQWFDRTDLKRDVFRATSLVEATSAIPPARPQLNGPGRRM